LDLNDEEMDVKRAVESKFIHALLTFLSEEDRGVKPHLTNFVYKCLRRGYWEWQENKNRKEKELRQLDEKETLTFAIGKKVHEIPMSKYHEFEVEYKGITGTVDEILFLEKAIVIVDKKTSVALRELAEHHQVQVEYYAVMLYENGYLADVKIVGNKQVGKPLWGAVLYVDINGKAINAQVFKIDLIKAKRELDEKIEIFKKCDETGKVPQSYIYWLCSYCPYYAPCRAYDANHVGREVQDLNVSGGKDNAQ
jgi:RecB family exonuclease